MSERNPMDATWGMPLPDGDHRHVVAFSGGKDSTAMALRMWELGYEFSLLHTPTGNELPELRAHLNRVVDLTRAPMVELDAPTLDELIREQNCLPNWRMRWCTRMIKIEPCQQWLKENPGHTLCVGLRADEPGRAGLYGEYCSFSYPLRAWNWGLLEVERYVERMGATPPARTDCAVCFYQTLSEWWVLWSEYPDLYAEGEEWEALTGYTFRSPKRDTRPASLKGLREEFQKGYKPKKRKRHRACRVCSM